MSVTTKIKKSVNTYQAIPVFKVLSCPICEDGELVYTGENKSCKNGKCGFPHKCNKCVYVEHIGVKFPYQTYVRGEKL